GCCLYRSPFEASALDIEAGVSFLRAVGAERVILVGHSLGANQVAYYAGSSGDRSIGGIVLLAAPGNMHDRGFEVGGPPAATMLAEAARLLEAGDPAVLVTVPLGLSRFSFTAQSLVSNGG